MCHLTRPRQWRSCDWEGGRGRRRRRRRRRKVYSKLTEKEEEEGLFKAGEGGGIFSFGVCCMWRAPPVLHIAVPQLAVAVIVTGIRAKTEPHDLQGFRVLYPPRVEK